MTTLFISDLHLSPSRPDSGESFLQFLQGPARHASALYILGDLFDFWAGDDDVDEPFNASVAGALAACSRGTPIFLMRGNRDFLMGERLATHCGATRVDDPLLIHLHGAATLLTHGDTLCTDDLDYQRFRAEVRSDAWIDAFLSKPIAERRAQIGALRARSELEKRGKSAKSMDVNDMAVDTLLRRHGYPRLIHGHTHLAGRHDHTVDGHACERWVLGDWYQRGNYLRAEPAGLSYIAC